MPYWSASFRFNFPKSLNNWPHHASSAEKPERPKDSARAAKKTPAGPDQKTPKNLFSKKTIVLLRLVLKLLFHMFHCFLFLMKRSNLARLGASCWCITGQKQWVASTTRMAREDQKQKQVLHWTSLQHLSLFAGFGRIEPTDCCLGAARTMCLPVRREHVPPRDTNMHIMNMRIHIQTYIEANSHISQTNHFWDIPFSPLRWKWCRDNLPGRVLRAPHLVNNPRSPGWGVDLFTSWHIEIYAISVTIDHPILTYWNILCIHIIMYILYTSVYYCVFLPAFLLSSITYAFIII